MTEAMVINSFFIVRVIIVGGLLMLLPRLMRKGLLFGVYVGEEVISEEKARRLKRSWLRDCIFVMLFSLVIGLGISFIGNPLAGNLTGTVVLICTAIAMYIVYYYKTRKLIPASAMRQAQKSVAVLDKQDQSGLNRVRIILGICLIVSLTIIYYALHTYYQLPKSSSSEVPAYFGFIDYLFIPLLNLIFSSVFAFYAVFIAGAKRTLRERTDAQSIKAQDAFKKFFIRMFSIIAVLFCLTLSQLSIQIIQLGSFDIKEISVGTWFSFVALFIFMMGSLIRIIRTYGQGGALREHGSKNMPLTGSLTDNEHWLLGLFYFDKSDPSLVAEKRFGFGYSLNYANHWAVIFTVTQLTLLIILIVMAVLRFAF